VAKGHNLKLTYEFLDPNTDVSQDQRERYSAVYEYAPIQFTQFRLGCARATHSPEQRAERDRSPPAVARVLLSAAHSTK